MSEQYFDKILIANRGEIACRVIRTCRRLGIKTVAIFSEPDRYSVHVTLADEAICVGPAASSASYLNIPNILRAVKETGAQAVHPGYGFLSENRRFQEALAEAGVKFIGPGTEAIQAMGDKISSKKIAKEAGVNIIPGYLGAINNDDELLRIAREVGYPVMIKASAGGGGKGMRIAYDDREAVDGYRLSKAEAMSSFGDDTMFVEKYIEEPRHIEIQLLADAHGNAVYLNERECSVQRRNQKVIEEAPSTFLTPATRRAMGEQAVALAKAVGYESAGTCEFLVDKHRQFYFLEMNTRLQVEHPVTEAITGLDLVEHMIRVATGEPLSFKQRDVQLKGWALESRVYAEDPLRGFLPSIGKLVRYVEPRGEGVRVDSGVREGSDISVYYDPMISKLITYGQDRNEALALMRKALDEYVIRGVTHNVNFLRSLCDHPRFIRGELSTAFIPEEYPDGYKGATMSEDDLTVLLGTAVAIRARQALDTMAVRDVWDVEAQTRLDASVGEMVVSWAGRTFQVRAKVNRPFATMLHMELQVDELPQPQQPQQDEHDHAQQPQQQQQLPLLHSRGRLSTAYQIGATVVTVTYEADKRDNNTKRRTATERGPLSLSADAPTHTLQVLQLSAASNKLQLITRGTSFTLRTHTPLQHALQAHMPVHAPVDTSKQVLSPMPGVVYSVKVSEGDEVVAGQEVAVVEAMKMQNALRAAGNGRVKKVLVKQGQTVSADEVLIELE